MDGGQGEAVGVPQAQGTLGKLPVGADSALLPLLLTLSDVFCVGHHAAVKAGVGPRTTLTVIGDGAVGLSAVLAARRLGAERIRLLGRHQQHRPRPRVRRHQDDRRPWGQEGIARVWERTGGTAPGRCWSVLAASRRCRRRSGWPATAAWSAGSACPSIAVYGRAARTRPGAARPHLTGGAAPARAYLEELLPAVLEGTVEPGRVVDRAVSLEQVPDGYRAMADREALKVLIRP